LWKILGIYDERKEKFQNNYLESVTLLVSKWFNSFVKPKSPILYKIGYRHMFDITKSITQPHVYGLNINIKHYAGDLCLIVKRYVKRLSVKILIFWLSYNLFLHMVGYQLG
jgi:hypothetical protein